MEALQGAMQVQQWPDLSCLWSLPVPSDHLNRWSPKSWTKWTLLSLCRHWWAFYSHFTRVAHRLGGWSLDILSKDERKGWISSDLWANVLVLFWRKFFTLRPLYFIPEHWYKNTLSHLAVSAPYMPLPLSCSTPSLCPPEVSVHPSAPGLFLCAWSPTAFANGFVCEP